MFLFEGVVAIIFLVLDMIYEMYYVNVMDQLVNVYFIINVWIMFNDDVVVGIWGGSVWDEYINILFNSIYIEWSRCVMNEDVEVLFVVSYIYGKGVEFIVVFFDGKIVGEVFYMNMDWYVF